MTQPTAYNKTTNFTAHSTANPTTPHSGVNLDAEFANIETTLDETLVNLALIQRDDGALKNQSVHKDAFDSTALALMGGSWTPRGDWVTGTSYAVSDGVANGGVFYVCVAVHTSNVFATDLAAGKWLAVVGNAVDVVFTPTGTIAATTVQGAIEELDADGVADAAALAAHLVDAVDAHDASAISNVPAGNIAATTVQAAINELDTEKAADSAVVHLTGAQTIADVKTFSSAPVMSAGATIGTAVVSATGVMTAGTVPVDRIKRTEANGTNAAAVTVTAASTIVATIDLGTVNTGDRVLISARVAGTKGATAGQTTALLSASGTASISVYGGHTSIDPSTPASGVTGFALNSWVVVTAGGTLTVGVNGISAGSDLTVAISDSSIVGVVFRAD